jgi:hypothetical protein
MRFLQAGADYSSGSLRIPNVGDTDSYLVRGPKFDSSEQSLAHNSSSGNKGSSIRYLKRMLSHSFGILVLSLGTGVALLLYLLRGKIEWNRRELVTLVPQGNVLLFTAIVSKMVLTISPLLMGIAAYYIANDWVFDTTSIFRHAKASQRRNSTDTKSLPTPFQYALILKMFQGASIFSFWNTLRYLFRSSSNRRQLASKPLLHSLFILSIILFLSYSLIAIDFALHSLSLTRFLSAKFESIPVPDPSSPEAKLYGRELKNSCRSLDVNGTTCTAPQNGVGWSYFTASYEEGYRTLVNLSDSTRIAFASLEISPTSSVQVALLTTADPSPEVSFTASTIGLYTQCSSLAPYCDLTPGACNPTFHPTNLSTGEDNFANCKYIPCSKPEWPIYWVAGFFNQSLYTFTEPLEMRNQSQVNDDTRGSELSLTDQNPFRIFSTLTLYIDPEGSESACAEYSPLTGRCIRGTDEAFLYSGRITDSPTPNFRLLPLGCSVTIINAQYIYLNGTYTIEPSTISLSDNSTALSISSVLYTRDAPTSTIFDTAINLSQAGESSEVVLANFEGKVSLFLASMAQSAFDTVPITQQSRVKLVAATVLPMPLIVTFFGLLIAYAMLVVILTGFAAAASKGAISSHTRSHGEYPRKANTKNIVELARRRLCEPASLVYELFESHDDNEGRWMKGAGIEMFEEGSKNTNTLNTVGREDEVFISRPGRSMRMRVVGVGLRPDRGFGFSTE